MTENKNKQLPNTAEEEIDLVELARKMWSERRFIFKCCGIAALIGLIVAFSTPREYSTSVVLAPELGGKSGSGSMGALAAMAGINLGMSGGEDALSPDLYPDIVSSTPFLIELFDINVTDIDQELEPGTTLYSYLDEHQKSPWWSYVTSAPFRALGWFISLLREAPEVNENATLNPFMLTKKETAIAKILDSRISVAIDKNTGITTLSVMMQDPLISATLTDTVMTRLQNYITDYRTTKARHDLAFSEKLYSEAKENYYTAQQNYARAIDINADIVKQSYRAEIDRLQNEMNLTYGIYNQVAQQLQMARAKVQEITPVYTVVQPATVPLRAAKPRKAMILIGFVFLAGVGSVGWVLFIKDIVRTYKNKESID